MDIMYVTSGTCAVRCVTGAGDASVKKSSRETLAGGYLKGGGKATDSSTAFQFSKGHKTRLCLVSRPRGRTCRERFRLLEQSQALFGSDCVGRYAFDRSIH